MKGLKAAADILTWSRLLVALLVVALYDPSIKARFIVMAGLLLYAELSDHLDGILARKGGSTGYGGYIFDSLNDRAVYAALILVIVNLHEVPLTLAWLLVFRDIAVYAVRALQRDWLEQNRLVRPLHLCHATFIRFWFLGVLVRHGSILFHNGNIVSTKWWHLMEISCAVLAAIFSYVALYLSFGRALKTPPRLMRSV